MARIPRREFLAAAAAAAFSPTVARGFAAAAAPPRKFTMDLVCGAIGVRADQREALRLAQLGGFESVQPSPDFLARSSPGEVAELLASLRQRGLSWGVAGLPVKFRDDEPSFQQDLEKLAPLASALQRVGASRMGTWISPRHDQLTYRTNFQLHVRRLREVGQRLADHGQRLGLEYVGPKLSWSAGRYPFIHTMAEAKELIAEIGLENVGLTLDSWHWYTAGETAADLLRLQGREVISCHLNDAPAGVPVEQQVDNQRALPASTGVIDLKTFLGSLVQIGYDGPVYAEPFDRSLRELDSEAAIAKVAAAMRKAMALAS